MHSVYASGSAEFGKSFSGVREKLKPPRLSFSLPQIPSCKFLRNLQQAAVQPSVYFLLYLFRHFSVEGLGDGTVYACQRVRIAAD